MTRGKKWALGVVLVLTIAVAVTWAKIPDIVRWFVKDNYAGINPQGDIHVDWTAQTVTLHEVGVERPGISATLSKVVVDRDKNVTITGGTLGMTLNEESGGGGTGESAVASITASDLEVTITRGDIKAVLSKTRINATEVCFRKGSVSHPRVTADIEDGCVQRDKTKATAVSVVVPVKVPFDIPRVKTSQLVKLTGVEVEIEDKLLRFNQATLGPFTAEASTIKVSDESVFVDTQAIRVDHPWVSPYPAKFNAVGLTFPRELFKGGEGIVLVRVGRVGVRIDPRNHAIEGDESCGEWFDAIPQPLPEAMQGMAEHFTGGLRFDVRAKPTPHLEIKHDCKFKCSESPIKGLVGKRFTYLIYDKDNKLVERTTGPGAPGWVPFYSLPEQIPEAFRLMEDPGFHNHKGLSVMALFNSFKANLEKGSFVKGGSTITMQLAKNLWLRRHKTIGRKVNEALLTLALESCLSKAQIMELYLNVIEFGPNLYGIGPASKHYFKKYPSELTPDEAFYLASILPRPRTSLPPHAGGLDRAKRLMTRLANSGFISDALIPIDDDELGDDDTSDWKVLD